MGISCAWRGDAGALFSDPSPLNPPSDVQGKRQYLISPEEVAGLNRAEAGVHTANHEQQGRLEKATRGQPRGEGSDCQSVGHFGCTCRLGRWSEQLRPGNTST